MSNITVVSYTITEEEIHREAALEYLNNALNKYTEKNVWLRGAEVNDYLQFIAGGYLDDNEVNVAFNRCNVTETYAVVFTDEGTEQLLLSIVVPVATIEELLNDAS